MAKKHIYLTSLILAIFACSAIYAEHAFHRWTKVSEQEMDGRIVCQWKCGAGYPDHFESTSGYGRCPTKM
jgi:hypothetical protein